MGASQSLLKDEQRCVRGHRQHCDKPVAQVQRRIQLLEELCSHGSPGMRAAVLEQLAGGQAHPDTLEVANVLVSIPPEFSPGELIAAGSYGRVYAGTYAGQPAALKLLLLDEDTAHAILNEVRLCLKLNHKNLVQLLDCAVVATSKEAAAAGFPVLMCGNMPWLVTSVPALTGQHQVLPLFGSSSSMPAPSAECPFSYLPVVSGRAPFSSSTSAVGHQAMLAAASKEASSMALAEVSRADSCRLPVLSTSLGHACFEVWIAMELCDGGTLAEQLQRGFHCHAGSEEIDMEQLLQVGLDIARALAYMHLESVCHGDLKTENVLLKTLSPASEADMQRACASCGSSSCQDDCNWLTFVCSNSTGTSNTCTSRCCRSCSADSCWSCGTRVGCLDNGSSSPDSCSTSSSNVSGPSSERRSSRLLKGSHILSGLCCIGSSSSTEDDAWDEEERVKSGCFACGGCGVMTLEPTKRSQCTASVDTVQHQQQHEHEQHQVAEQQQQLGQQQAQPAAAPYSPGQPDEGSFPRPSWFAPGELSTASSSSCSTAAPLHYGGFNPWSQGLPAAIVEGQEQPMQLPLLPLLGLHNVSTQSDSFPAVEDGPEEEHVAPLSLYTQARQRRRSRCLPHGVVLPAALAAAAAAAAMNASDALHGSLGSAGSSGGGSTSSGSEDEGGQLQKQLHARAGLPPMQPLPRHRSLDDSCLPSTTAGLLDASLGLAVAGSSAHLSEVRPSWQDPAALSRLGSRSAAPACEVYAHSMMRPPVARRARRHSYCYGSAASYGASVFSYSKPGPGGAQPTPAAGISASDAAAAIAAAADAVLQDSARAACSPPLGSRRNRRMSWDSHMLRQQSPTRSGLSGLLSAALPGLARLSIDGPAQGAGGFWGMQQQPLAPASSRQGGRRTRRHSWAGYLQPDMSGAAAALGWGMHSSLAPDRKAQQQEQQQQQLTFKQAAYGSLHGASIASVAGSSNGQARKARRHSWAGYAGYGLEQVPNRLSGFRALSSCFAADGTSHPENGGLQTSLSRHMFSLPQFPGCCGESFFRPLDDPRNAGDCSRAALLDGVPSSSLLEDGSMADCLLLSGADVEGGTTMGCFGRWCSGSGTSSSFASSIGSGSHQKGKRRRYSWCCGAGSEAELWADLTRGDSSQTELLSGAAPLSVPLLRTLPQQQRKQRRDRRCSWDDFRYRSKLSQNWGRKAASLDAQLSTPDSWCSQHLSIGSRSSDAVSRQSQLYRSSSDAAAAQVNAAAAAAAVTLRTGCQSEGLPRVAPLSKGSPAADSIACQQQGQPQPGAQVMQPMSSPPSFSSSPTVGKQCITPAVPIKLSAPRAPVAADTWPDVQVDQSLSGLSNVCMALPLPVANTSRVRVSLDQPPLPPSPAVQQQASKKPLCEAAKGAQQPPMAWAVPTASVRQVTVQDLLSLCAPAHQPAPASAAAAAATGGAAAAAGAPAGPGMALVGPLDSATAAELFTGSFPLHTSSSRVGLVSSAAADSGARGAAGKSRGRRWSTGVAAQQLLMRKQLLDADGCAELGEAGLQQGSSKSPSTAAAADVSTHVGAAHEQPMPLGTWHVPVGDAYRAPRLPRSSSSSTSSAARRASGLESSGVSAAINVLGMPRQRPAVMSQRRMSYDTATGAYQVVLQMDEKQLSKAQALSPSQQLLLSQAAGQAAVQQQRQASPVPVEVCDLLPGRSSGSRTAGSSGHDTQSAAGSCSAAASPQKPSGETPQKLQAWQDEQMQQQCQAQMQRLLEALAKKGYSGVLDADGAPSDGSNNAGASSSPQLAPRIYDPSRAVASLEHQQEVAHNATHVPQRRFCAKVCDFGFSKCLRAGQSHCSTASAGTITHQAPEVLRSGHLSPAADVYAFGIILWELLTRDRPFRGLLEGDLVVGVCDQGLRPVFPPGCPASYVALAQQCWSDDPAVRPTAAQLLKRLNELLYEERRARLRASAGVHGVHHSSNSSNQHCRRRRHSMPIAGYSRQRRRSRRMSLFLLPFTRQPVVPEDAPLDQQLDDWRCTTSGQHVCAVHSTGGPGSQGRSSSEQQSSCGSPHRLRGSSLPQSSGVNSSGCHVSMSGCSSAANSAGVAAASESAGGLLSNGGALARLKGVLTAAASAGSMPVSAVHVGSEAGPAPARGAQSGPAAAGEVSGDGTEWFESF